MTSRRTQEWVFVWVMTIAAMSIGAYVFVRGNYRAFIGIALAYPFILFAVRDVARLAIPAHERHRYPCPWGLERIRSCHTLSEAHALFPGLRRWGNDELWQMRCEGDFGIWELQPKERYDGLIGYSLSY